MSSKKYFQDRPVVLLLSINAFLAVLTVATLVFQLFNSSNQVYITEYRQNLGLGSAFGQGGKGAFITFMVFVLLAALFHAILSKRIYHIRRHLSIAVLALGTVLIVFAAVVSNALLGSS